MPNPIYDEGYRYATQRYDLDGSTIDFEFNFDGGYISEDYVKAFYKNLDLSEEEIDRSLITFVGPNQLRIPDAALQPITRKLVIRRDTPKNLPLVDFTDGSILNERNLDKNTKQAIHDVAELVDFIADILAEWRTLYQDILDLLTTIDTLVQSITDILADMNFTALEDTPDSYADQSGKLVVVKENETGLEFKTIQEIVTDSGAEFGIPDAPEDDKNYIRFNSSWIENSLYTLKEYSNGIAQKHAKLSFSSEGFHVTAKPNAFDITGATVGTSWRPDTSEYLITLDIEKGYLNIGGVDTLCPTGIADDLNTILSGGVVTSVPTLDINDLVDKEFYVYINKSDGTYVVNTTVPNVTDHYLLYKITTDTVATGNFVNYTKIQDLRTLNQSTGGGSGESSTSQLFIYIDGYFPVSNLNVYRLICSEAITIKSTGAKANSETETTEEFSLSIYKNGSEVGTIDFATSASEATFDIASDIALAVGDILEIKPTSSNNSLSNLALTFIVQK